MAFVNRHLEFHPWQSSNVDSQYSESRVFQTEEFARLHGLPPHLLAQTEKATSWGTGIAEQNLGLARYTLMTYTSRIESALKPLNPPGVFQEFDYKGLLQGAPKDEIELLLKQTEGELLTIDEARAILNLGPAPQTEGIDLARARLRAEFVQKAYLGVDKVWTSAEARAEIGLAGDLPAAEKPDLKTIARPKEVAVNGN
jgi:phage portal protein BeeE